ncbi:hypothetical protein FACS1894217_05010 [Clostridia bacterium]|nr:hypothetical protein FACS1894217_05010 [Clostridia bacterium]
MKEQIFIRWETGKMTINLEYFFPCSQKNFKILLKTIALDWQDGEETKDFLKVYFQKKINDAEKAATETCHYNIMKRHKNVAKKYEALLKILNKG